MPRHTPILAAEPPLMFPARRTARQKSRRTGLLFGSAALLSILGLLFL